MILKRLPTALVQCLLLEWLSPETVFVAARASGVLRRAALSITTNQFRAADEVLSAACIRWFREHRLSLVLWTTILQTDTSEVVYLCNGVIHRDGDLPARIEADGTRYWYQNGERHRDGDEPAYIGPQGTAWWKHDKPHRDGDLPAVVRSNGTQEWYQNGNRHRAGDLPAVVWQDGTQRWYQNGQKHRDGDLPAVVLSYGTQEWYQNGKQHRDGDLPAEVWNDGSQTWYQHGKLHRDDDQPAVIEADGAQEWYSRGKRHRDTFQPATICPTERYALELYCWRGFCYRIGCGPVVMSAFGRKFRVYLLDTFWGGVFIAVGVAARFLWRHQM